MGVEFKGFDELEEYLQDLADKAETLNGERKVSFDELFVEDFMASHTKFSSFNELLDNSPFEVNSAEDFESIPDAEFDSYIRQVSDFDSWNDMLEEASTKYAVRQLGF